MGYQERLAKKRLKEIESAKSTGAVFECQCCFDSDCLLTEVCICEGGCMLCRDCVKRGVGVAIGDNKTEISCLAGCQSNMADHVIKEVLPAKTFQLLLQRRQIEEVEAAGIEDLEKCTACNFATIMPNPGDKVIVCGNPECGKETCRLCKEPSHLPLSCDEVEKDAEVDARTKLENAATEAMIRECIKCKNRFFKEDGCNKMTCKCGQSMCYLCRKPVPNDYTHFYGQGASPMPGLCPLWSDNKNLHKDEVIKAVEAAKKKIDLKNLKYDPTKNMDKPPAGFDRKVIRPEMIQEEEDDDEDEDDDFDDDSDEDMLGFINDDDEDEFEEGYRFFDY